MIVRNYSELERINSLIHRDLFCLAYCLLDAQKLTGNKINDLDIDTLEYVVIHNIDRIIINQVEKLKMSYKESRYKLELDIWINSELFRINTWFIYNKKDDIFEHAEIYMDN